MDLPRPFYLSLARCTSRGMEAGTSTLRAYPNFREGVGFPSRWKSDTLSQKNRRFFLGFSVALTQAASGRPPVQSRPRGESLARRGASLHQAFFCVGIHNSAYVLSFPLKKAPGFITLQTTSFP